MDVVETDLAGVLLIEPRRFRDERGFFLESFQAPRYREFGILDKFVQDNHSRSRRGVLRGLHFTIRQPQAQIVTVMRGCIFDAVVDLRSGSPTFGNWVGVELSDGGAAPALYGTGVRARLLRAQRVCRSALQGQPTLRRGRRGWACSGTILMSAFAGRSKRPLVSPRDAAYPRLGELDAAWLPHMPPQERDR